MDIKINPYCLFASAALMFSQSSYALSGACENELRELIVPPLQYVFMKKKDIRVEMEDLARGVYSVRLFVPADSPINRFPSAGSIWIRTQCRHWT